MDQRDRKTKEKLVNLAKAVVHDVNDGTDPSVDIPLRSLSNVTFNEQSSIIELGDQKSERQFFNVRHTRKFMQTFLVAAACKELIEQGKTTSIRDLFYMTWRDIAGSKTKTFDGQEESDPVIEDLEVAIQALREELHLFASNRGAMVGPMTIVDSGDTIDLRRMGSGGWSVPSIVESNVLQFKKTEAEFVLLVEKDAVWRRLNEDKFWKAHKCMVIHGNGMAPRGVRRLVYRMHYELGLPVYVLVDNDPWGLYIYSVVKQGSINLAFESARMAVPRARFLGLSSSDPEAFGLSSDVGLKLGDQDVKRAQQMLNYAWFQEKKWQQEIRTLLRSGRRYELEAFSQKGISFITEEYLPRKIKDELWLV